MEDKFYVLANKSKKKLGYFLLELDCCLSSNISNHKYVIKWVDKLEIGDGGLQILNYKESKQAIIVSFKVIYENTYTVLIVDKNNYRILYKHNSYQLWESPCLGFLNTFTNDFIILNRDGTSFIPLGDNTDRRAIENRNDTMRMVHSLNSASFLKIEDSNMIQFERPMVGENNRVVQIQEQHYDAQGNTYYDEIFRLNMQEMNLIELLLIQSVFNCETSVEIMDLIKL